MPQAQRSINLLGMMADAMSAERTPAFVSGRTGQMLFEPAPIDPTWILKGNPVASIARHSQSGDEAASTAVWDCTAGEFRWYFGWDETVYILDGQVEVTSDDGTVQVLNPGDIAYFKGGTWATWKIETHLRKIAFLRRPFPKPIALAYRLRNLLRGQKASRAGL